MFVLVDVLGHDFCSDAGIVVNLVGNEFGFAVLADKLEPVEHGGSVGLDVGRVGPEALARDDIFQAVAINVDQIDGVEL